MPSLFSLAGKNRSLMDDDRGMNVAVESRHPVISDTVAILEHELGATMTLRLLASCAISQATETIPQILSRSRRFPAGSQLIEDETAYGLWAALWDALALERPRAFAMHPAALHGKPSPTTLAFLYSLKHDLIQPFQPARAEKLLLQGARDALSGWTGLTSFGSLTSHSFNSRCRPLRALESVDGWVGMSLADQPALADQIVLDGRYVSRQRRRPGGLFEVASLIVHEEIHGAFATERQLAPPLYAHKLAGAVNEAATSFLEIAAVTVAQQGRATLADVRRRVSDHGYRKPILALIALLPKRCTLDECAQHITALIDTTLNGRSDAAALAAVNKISCRRLDADRCARLFGEV